MTIDALRRLTKPMTIAESEVMARRIDTNENASNDAFAPIKHVFLDLEDTIITPVLQGWYKTEVINVAKVKAFIAEFKPDFVHLFSFAIWNQEEMEKYRAGTKPMLETALGIKLSWEPIVDDEILPNCMKVLNLRPGTVTFSDMSDFWGKQEAFRLNMRHRFKDNSTPVEVVLLDDAVYNETFEFHGLQVKGRVLNIDQMEEPHGLSKHRATTLSNS